jgi:DNA-binding transcriptional LysR family regulator
MPARVQSRTGSWRDLEVLLALLRARTAGEAGERLGVDRTTVSRHIAALEGRLGSALFVRTRDGLRPTPAAERLRPAAERMEREAATIAQLARSGEGEVAGNVRLATTEALASFLVAEGLLAVRDAHPRLTIEILGGNRPVDLRAGEADLALRVVPSKEATLKVRCVARFGVGLFASPSYLALRGRPRGASLAGHDVVLPSGELGRMPEAAWLAARKGARVAFRSSSMLALFEAVAAGVGVGVFTLPWGGRDPRLELLSAVDVLGRRGVWLVAPPAGSSRPEVRVVGDRVATIMRRASGV